MLLYQPESGYCYNSDSIFLYDFINSFKPKGNVLDVGAGCGVVGLLVARDNSQVKLEAVEKQEIFIPYAQTNARVNKIAYTLHTCDFLTFKPQTKYDFVISNPPFYPEGVQKSKDEILAHARYNSNLPVDAFFKKVSQILKPHSHFIFCYDATQFGNICVALEKVKMRAVDVQFVHPKRDRNASLVMLHVRNGSKADMKIHEPIMHFDAEEPSLKTQEVYKNAKTQSIKCQI